jgi:hypothetical protein
MKARILLLGTLTALTALMAFSCERSTKPEQKVSATIRGKVTEPSGNALSNAAVMLTYNFKASNSSIVPKFIKGDPPAEYYLYQNSPNPFNPVTDVFYDIPEACQVKLWIMDYSREDTVKILVDEFRETGHYNEAWDGKNEQGKGVVNGVYYYHITAGSFSDSKSMILSFPYTDHSSPDTLEHHALTNNDGYFEISQDFLPFGHESMGCDSAGNEIGIIVITRQVDIWALHNSYLPARVDSVDVHSISGADITIQFSE